MQAIDQKISQVFITDSDEHHKGVSNRYGHHKHLVRRTQLREKIMNFLSPRFDEIPMQPKKEDSTRLEHVSLKDTYNKKEKLMKVMLFKVDPLNFLDKKREYDMSSLENLDQASNEKEDQWKVYDLKSRSRSVLGNQKRLSVLRNRVPITKQNLEQTQEYQTKSNQLIGEKQDLIKTNNLQLPKLNHYKSRNESDYYQNNKASFLTEINDQYSNRNKLEQCPSNYQFYTNYKLRNLTLSSLGNKTNKSIREQSFSKKQIQINLSKSNLIKENGPPSPNKYYTQEGYQQIQPRIIRNVKLVKDNLDRSEFLYTKSKKDLDLNSHSILQYGEASYATEGRSSSFGPSTSRDQASYLKDVVSLLNKINQEKQMQKISKKAALQLFQEEQAQELKELFQKKVKQGRCQDIKEANIVKVREVLAAQIDNVKDNVQNIRELGEEKKALKREIKTMELKRVKEEMKQFLEQFL